MYAWTALQVPSLASRSNAKPYLGVTSIPLPRAVPPPAAEVPVSTKARERRRRQEEVEVRAAWDMPCRALSWPWS